MQQRIFHRNIGLASLVLAGTLGLATGEVQAQVFAVARVNHNGTPDTTFSGDGKIAQGITGAGDWAQATARQADGKAVVVGSGNGKILVARYTAAGSIDATFNGGGSKLIDLAAGFFEEGNAVAIDASGRIVVAGTVTPPNLRAQWFVLRLNASGAFDTSFGGTGIVITDFGSTDNEEVGDMVIQSNGKIVVGGYAETFGSSGQQISKQFALARYNTNGSLDTTFDGDAYMISL